MAAIKASPDDLRSCEASFKGALLMHRKAEEELCDVLFVDRQGLQQALLTTRMRGMTPSVQRALVKYHQAESDLFKADQLLELAREVAQSCEQCHADHLKLEC